MSSPVEVAPTAPATLTAPLRLANVADPSDEILVLGPIDPVVER